VKPDDLKPGMRVQITRRARSRTGRTVKLERYNALITKVERRVDEKRGGGVYFGYYEVRCPRNGRLLAPWGYAWLYDQVPEFGVVRVEAQP